MQNAYHTAKTMFAQPSLRAEIDIHGLDYDFPETPTRPAVKTGDDAVKNTVMPDKPAVTQEASSPQSATTAPSYKAPISSPAVQDGQQSAITIKTTAALSIKPSSEYTAETFIDAVRSGCLDSVLRHIDAGVEVNVGLTPHGKTPLMHAADCGHEAIVRQLLEAGAYVDQSRTGGLTALIFAAQNGHTATVQVLLDNHATVDRSRTDGATALMFAALNGHTEIVQLLLKVGANSRLNTKFGETALSIAIDNKHNEVKKLLRAHEADINPQRKGLFQQLFG